MRCAIHGDRLELRDDERLIASAPIPTLGGILPQTRIDSVMDGVSRVRLTWHLDRETAQDELAVSFRLETNPDFWWTPHLIPEDGWCAAQHVFRSPALIAAEGAETLALIPDLDLCGLPKRNPWFLDLSAPERTLTIGMSLTEIPVHVGYRKIGGMTFDPGSVTLGFYLLSYRDDGEPRNPWGPVARFLWERWGRPLFEKGEPLTVPMDRYVEHVYRWAFDTWKNAVWQEFDIDGKRVGSPAFIVNVTESPNYPGEVNLREFLSVWNQAWFSSLRGASGVFRHARRTNDPALREKANLTKEFALAAPMRDGVFPVVYRTEMEQVEIDGKKYNRSKGWETGYWTNSNRVPWERGITDQWFHVLDMSWTALLMLRWHQELEPDDRLLNYARAYAAKLRTLQDADGFFPAWLHPETLEPSPALAQGPETSMSVTFLLKLAEIDGDADCQTAALRAMDAVIAGPASEGRWEDFETFWSCCGWGKQDYLGRKIPRNDLHKQCNFSMFWTAEALLESYRRTGDSRWLNWGRRTLDELSMCQQVWQPPFIYVPALGGFGVMNFDGEWCDSRQCLFAELFLDYARETGDAALFERGIAALKSSFTMMYCPENPAAKALWEKVWPFFGPADYGFTMENYGHTGHATEAGEGVGEFTIYDWGNGAAAEARGRIRDHYGDVFIDRDRGWAFGIDSAAATLDGDALTLKNLADTGRTLILLFADGTRREVVFDAGGETLIASLV